MSTFDPTAFLSTQFESGFSTEYVALPDDDYIGVVREPKDPTRPSITVRQLDDGRLVLDLNWTIEDEKAKAATGMAVNFARQSVWLDTTPNGGLDRGKGKNVQLGQVLDAMGLNKGEAFSWSSLYNRPCRCKTKARTADDGRTYVDVKAVAKL